MRFELGVVLPQWEDAAYGSASLRRQWDRFLERMRAHRATRFSRRQRNRRAYDPDCAEKDRRYDQDTEHGKKQGAVLHP